MARKAAQLADHFDQANEEVIQAIAQSSDAQWGATCPAEGWSVGVAAHHVASSHEPIAGAVQAVANSQPLPAFTQEMIDQGNAQHVQQFANCTKAETLDLLQRGGAAASATVRGLSDEQLGRSAEFLGHSMTAEQFIEGVLIGHVEQHLKGMKAAGVA